MKRIWAAIVAGLFGLSSPGSAQFLSTSPAMQGQSAAIMGMHITYLGPVVGRTPTPIPTGLKMGTYRFWDDFGTWGDFAPTFQRVYNWQVLDGIIANAQTNNPSVQFIYTFGNTPPWVRANHVATLPPDNLGVTSTAAVTSVATPVLTFSGGVPAGLANGMNVTDLTTPAAIPGITIVMGSISGTVLTVTQVISGPPLVNGTTLRWNVNQTAGTTTISSFGTGTGGTGTYNLAGSFTVATNSITAGTATKVSSFTGTTVTLSQAVTASGGDSIHFTDDVTDFGVDLANHLTYLGVQSLFKFTGWNEAWLTTFFTGTSNQLLMVQQSWYHAIKSVISTASVASFPVVNGTQAQTATWLTQTGVGTGETGAQVSDAFDFHGYSYSSEQQFFDPGQNWLWPTLQTFLTTNGMSGKPVEDSEMGWATQKGVPNTFDKVGWISRAYLVRAALGITLGAFYAYDGSPFTFQWGQLWSPGPDYLTDWHVASGGTNYVTGSSAFLVGGTENRVTAEVTINDVSGGVVVDDPSNTIWQQGSYSSIPSNPVTTSIATSPGVSLAIGLPYTSGTGTSFTPTMPTHNVGDLLMMPLIVNTGSQTLSTPSGWTLQSTLTDGSASAQLWSRVATGTDPAPTVTWSSSAAYYGWVLDVADVSATPLGALTGASGTGTSGSVPSITTLANNSVAVGISIVAGPTSPSLGSGYNNVASSSSGGVGSYRLQDLVMGAAGSSTPVMNFTFSPSNPWRAWVFEAEPATPSGLTVTATWGTVDAHDLKPEGVAYGETFKWLSGATVGLWNTSGFVGSPPATATVSIASPGVVSWASNTLSVGSTFSCTTTGALPTGMTPGTPYYVISAGFSSGVSFEFSATLGGAAINTSGSQSGVHTCMAVTYTQTLTRASIGYQGLAIWNRGPLNSGNSPVSPTTTYTVPAPYTQYHKLDGTVVTGAGGTTINITGQPILLENKSAF